uniref:Ig-like domain-containing protein n=1 Tax=Salarias fasciatus TaxID=181472 RepID=A0A672F985_SALFA
SVEPSRTRTWTCSCSSLLQVSSVQRTVSAVEGQTVSLPCEAPNDETITIVIWTRLDLVENQEVLLYRKGRFKPNNHPSYRNRVELKDVKDGDASLILKNVTFNDRGTFECFIAQRREQSRKKRSAEDTERRRSLLLLLILIQIMMNQSLQPPSPPSGFILEDQLVSSFILPSPRVDTLSWWRGLQTCHLPGQLSTEGALSV